MNDKFKFYAIDRAFGDETEIDADAIRLVCSDGQEFELAAYLTSGEVKIESKGSLSVRPDTMSSMVIEDVLCKERRTEKEDNKKKYLIAQEILKTKFNTDLADYVSEEEYGEFYRDEEPHYIVDEISKAEGLRRVMPKLEYLCPVPNLDVLSIAKQ